MSRLGSKVQIAEEPQYHESRPKPLDFEDSETVSGRLTAEDVESVKSWPEEADAFAVVELSCGTTHCFARTAGGHIYGWGANACGELGLADDSQTYFWVPKELVLPGKLVKQVSCGSEFTLAITVGGELWSWGKGFEGQLGLGHCRDQAQPCRVGLEHVLCCAAGEQHSAAVAEMTDGRFVFTWGMADSGVLGLGNFITCGPCNLPSQVEFETDAKKAGPQHPIMVRCGPNSTGVLCSSKADEEHSLFTFGNGWYGRLGHGDTNSQFHPTRISKLPKGLRDFSLGTDHSAAITMDQDLFVWGKASLLGEVQHVLQPKKFSIESASFRSVVCGESETFVVDTQGRLFAWGSNHHGQLGLGPQVGSFVQTPSHVKPIHDPVAHLISGGSFTVAHLENGDVLAWGSQSCGRLGLVEVKEERICWEPSLVVATWSTAAAVSGKKHGQRRSIAGSAGPVRAFRSDATYASAVTEATHEEKEDKGSKEKTMNVVSFVMLQTVLKQESTDHGSAELKLYAEHLEQTAQEIVKDIQKLQKEEEPLRKLEAQLSDSLKMNLRWFRGLIVPDASSTLVDARMPPHLSSYAKMCWILQHQAAYLTQLSQYIHGDEAEIFLEAIDALFGDVKDERQVHLFNSLQTCMIAKEAENAGGSPEKFMDKNDSVSFMVFSQRALRQAFAKEILFPFLSSKDSILELVGSISSAAQGAAFCLSYADFKEKLGSDGKGKDEVELNNIYSLSLNAFRDFLTGGFLKIIRKIQLPRSLRLAMRQVSLASQRWKDSDKLADIDDKEQRPYQPALRLFCYGIIEPIMREGARYAVPANFLKKSQQDYKPDDPQIASNFECIADFLDQMLSNTIDPKEKALMSAARLVKEELLTFVKQQSEVQDTTGSDILAAVLNSHYSRAKSFVTMSQAQIMKLSNLLKEWSSKLRIKEFDPLGACVQSVPEWDKESIMISERYEVRLNFEIETRFLMTAEEILLCKQSMCPLPSWACSAQTSPNLVYIEEEAAGNDQGAFFESLFQRLAPLESKNFATLRIELQDRRSQLASAATEEGYLEMINDLDTACQLITEWMDVGAEPRQLLDLLTERVRGRQRQFRYLEVTERYLKSILEKQLEYKQDLKQHITELKDAVGFSLSMKLPQTLSKACNEVGVTPSFQIIQKKMEFVPTLMATKDMAEIGCSYFPMATYPVAKLKKMKVLVEVCPPHSAMQKMMEMTFKKLDAQAVEITVCIAQGGNKNVIKTMTLDPAKLNQLRAAQSDEIAEFGQPGESPFMTCNASNFVSLLTKIEKGKA